MLKLMILFLSVYGVVTLPTILYSKPTVLNAAIKTPSLPGTDNLAEKTIPESKLEAITAANPMGLTNLAERVQERLQYLPGIENLAEKAIPEEGLRKMYS